MLISGWGNFPRVEARCLIARDQAKALAAIAPEPSLIARGNGRSYGDAAINRRGTLDMRPCQRVLAFDPVEGYLTCEAGMKLADVIDVFLPRGWFIPVTPGTKFVTIGGMIAADVHGKNHHHAGSIGDHLLGLTLALADGTVISCSRDENPDIFAATCGGMGLTGIILSASLRLVPVETAWIRQQTLRAANLAEAMQLFEQSGASTYSVAWIDCLARGVQLGRSIIHLGEHARAADIEKSAGELTPIRRRARRVRFDFPSFALNRWSVKAFNELYFRAGEPATQVIDYDRFFYPLDALLDWNRIYGRPGFVQYQCVLPKDSSEAGMTALLDRIAATGQGSFLAVLKLFGKASPALLSFPMEGYSLALDFPASSASFNLLLELDDIVADHGGRLYLAKDARMSAAMLAKGYPKLDEFRALRRRLDPEGKFASLQSQRLGL